MAWVEGNDNICGNTTKMRKLRGENAFPNGPWSILVGGSSLRGIGSCLASDSSLKSVSILTLGAEVTFMGVSGESTEGESRFVI